MVKLFALLSLFLLLPGVVNADTLVTWTSQGAITFSHFFNLPDRPEVPPPGTPYQLTMSLDPSAATSTFSAPPGSNCVTTQVTGSITIGHATYGLTGDGFTHAKLPGTNCSPGFPETQFLLGITQLSTDGWAALRGFSFMEFWYRDLLVADAFPVVPTTTVAQFQVRSDAGNFLVAGSGNLQAAGPEQPTPVPEPGTMTLVGLGLAAAIRRARAARRA
jgi:hypothetical protein